MRMPGLSIRELADGQALVFGIEDRIPTDMLPAVHETVLAAIRHCTRVVIADFSRATYISSSGPGLLAHYTRFFGARGIPVLAVRGPTEVMRRLAPTGVERMVPFYDSLQDALERAGLTKPIEAPE